MGTKLYIFRVLESSLERLRWELNYIYSEFLNLV